MYVTLLSPLQLCIQGSVLVLALMALRKPLCKTVPKWAVCVLWLIVFARFVVPWGLAVPVELADDQGILSSAARLARGIGITAGNGDGGAPAYDSAIRALSSQVASANDGLAPAAAASSSRLSSMGAFLGCGDVLAAIWLAGSVVALLGAGVLYLHGMRGYKDARQVEDDRVRRWLETRSTRRRIRLVCSMHVDSPMTYGIVRPAIVMPLGFNWGDWAAAHLALEHEYAHIVRLDALSKAFCLVVACLYWFNPFVWAAMALFSRDVELACDEAVVRRCTPRLRKAYAHLILDIAQSHAAPGRSFAASLGAGSLEERIVSIMATETKMHMRSLACVASGIAVIAALTLVVPDFVAAQGANKEVGFSKDSQVAEGPSIPDTRSSAAADSSLDGQPCILRGFEEASSRGTDVTAVLGDSALTVTSPAWSVVVPRELVDDSAFDQTGERLFYAKADQGDCVENALRLPLSDGTVVEVYCADSDDVVWSDYLGEKVKAGPLGTNAGSTVMLAVYTLTDLKSVDKQPADAEQLEGLWRRAAAWVSAVS